MFIQIQYAQWSAPQYDDVKWDPVGELCKFLFVCLLVFFCFFDFSETEVRMNYHWIVMSKVLFFNIIYSLSLYMFKMY